MATTTVGRFSYDTETGEITGHAGFMRSDAFASWKRRFEAGDDVVFNCGVQTGQVTDVVTGMLVSLQTCFAGWHGMETFNRMRGA